MDLRAALDIVIELADANSLRPQEADSVELCREVVKQADAVRIVENFIEDWDNGRKGVFTHE